MIAIPAPRLPTDAPGPLEPATGDGWRIVPSGITAAGAGRGAIRGSTDGEEEDEDLGDEEDLAVAQPAADEDSAFDDFDDEFDDDFEEEDDDPDWDHPDEGEGELPPGKNPGRKK